MNTTDRFRRPEMSEIDCNLCVEGDDPATAQIRCMQSRGFSVMDEAQRPAGRPPMRSVLLRQADGRN